MAHQKVLSVVAATNNHSLNQSLIFVLCDVNMTKKCNLLNYREIVWGNPVL